MTAFILQKSRIIVSVRFLSRSDHRSSRRGDLVDLRCEAAAAAGETLKLMVEWIFISGDERNGGEHARFTLLSADEEDDPYRFRRS